MTEFIDDREVAAKDQDLLAHEQIADQLADLVAGVATPANVALYGPWGSGKTGIANLVRLRLTSQKGIRFARFDAFKYAENPLRRNFVSAVAGELGIKDSKFHEDLYTGRTTTDVEVPVSRFARLLGMYVVVLVAVSAATLLVAACVAASKHGGLSKNFGGFAGDAFHAALAPAALLTALFALVGRTLTVERRVERADSDEQFEQLFRQLVKKTGAERLVVFVDELDRCGASDVVATLDAVRTFLGVPGCVFIVAADQQVIEEALSLKLRQATPADSVNPYYSSGSAYLDKVFQYQITVPSLLMQSVTKFAADLVRDRQGIWSSIDIDLIVSVLIPSHVRSPRRVKHLLNAYVLAYRLAERRQKAGLLSTDIAARADEIARLVCLTVEFPLFARDLVSDARLPEHVLALYADPEVDLGPRVTEETKQLAARYAGLEADVDIVLSQDTDRPDDVGPTVRQAQGRQLVDYLSRTRTIRGPERDLIFLQTTGSVFGLPASLAETIELLAQDGNLASLRSSIDGLTAEERAEVISLLAQQARNEIGLVADNVAMCLLSLAQDPEIDLSGRADAVIEAISPSFTNPTRIMSSDTMPGAWRLSRASSRDSGLMIRRFVLAQDAAIDDVETACELLSDLSAALEAATDRTGEIVLRHLISNDAAKMVAALRDADGAAVAQLLAAVASSLGPAITDLLTDPIAAPVPPATVGVPIAATEVVTLTRTTVLASLGLWLDYVATSDQLAAQRLACAFLTADKKEVRDLVESRLGELGIVTAPDVANALLKAAERRVTSAWPAWLACLGIDLSLDESLPQLQVLVSKLWTNAMKNEPDTPEITRDVASRLAGIVERIPAQSRPSATAAVVATLSVAVIDEASANERLEQISRLDPLLTNGLAGREEIAKHQGRVLEAALTLGLPTQPIGTALGRYVAEALPLVLSGWSSTADAQLDVAAAIQLIEALDACSWLPEPDRTFLRSQARTLLPPGAELTTTLPDAAEVASIRAAHGASADRAIAMWIAASRPTVDDLVLAAKASLLQPSPDSSVLESVAAWQERLSGPEGIDLLKRILGDARESPPTPAALRAVGLDRASDAEKVRILVSRFEATTNNAERRAALALCKDAEISADQARRQLIEQVVIPVFGLNNDGKNRQAAEAGLEFLVDLARPVPSNIKTKLGNAVIEATQGRDKLDKRGIDALATLGYRITKSGGLFNRKRRVDIST